MFYKIDDIILRLQVEFISYALFNEVMTPSADYTRVGNMQEPLVPHKFFGNMQKPSVPHTFCRQRAKTIGSPFWKHVQTIGSP